MMMPSRETEEKTQHSTVLIPYSYYECRIPDYFKSVPMHWHSEFEVNYVLGGKGEFICGNERFLAKEGDILILPPNMLHSAYPYEDGKLAYQALVFSPVMLGANTNDRCTTECIRPLINGTWKLRTMITAKEKNYPDIKFSVDQIFSCVTGKIPYPELLLKSELLRLFWMLEIDEENLCREDAGFGYCDAIRPALEYMVKNFRENISVARLAEAAHLSKSYFMSCFKKAAGVSAIEYLAQLRINAACEALSSTEKRISDIAFGCGYDNLSNFNRQFKKIAGCSPNEYRKQSLRFVNPLDFNLGELESSRKDSETNHKNL